MAMVPSQNKRDKAVAPVRKDGKYVEMTVKGNWPIDIYRNGCKKPFGKLDQDPYG